MENLEVLQRKGHLHVHKPLEALTSSSVCKKWTMSYCVRYVESSRGVLKDMLDCTTKLVGLKLDEPPSLLN
jgi:hypothetical protein